MNSEKEMQALILAGGLGTRLRPITQTIPKPMVEICGKPFLEYQIKKLKESQINNLILCAGYLGHVIEEYFKEGKEFGVSIKYSYEKELLGTAGAIKKAEKFILSNPFIVINGDTYSDSIDFAKISSNFLGYTMIVTRATNPLEQELVEINNGMVTQFHHRGTLEHKKYLDKNPSPLINAGFYMFDKKILDLIPEGKKCSLEKEIFPQLIGNISAFEYTGYIKDLANINFCRELEKDISEGKIK